MALLQEVKADYGRLRNYINGEWVNADTSEWQDVENPATTNVIASVPLSTPADVNAAVAAAKDAFVTWREVPPVVRARYLFKLKGLMEDRFEDMARTIVQEHGKTIEDARGETRRAIENVEVAAGIPSLMMGYGLEDIARGLDAEAVRQPLGVFGIIGPFNFPLMVPMWFIPYAIATGNTIVIKPSEQVPLSQTLFVELAAEAGIPAGVINMVHGAKPAVDTLLNHPDVKGISFVGSSPVARYVYTQASANGKRVQCGGGAKNFLVAMPDARWEPTIDNMMGSIFGAAGQRCLAGSVVVPVGDAYGEVRERLVEGARTLKLGNGLDESVGMGPLISKASMDRVTGYVEKGQQEGAKLLVDRRDARREEELAGYFVGPCVFDEVEPQMTIAREEIFGPVAAIMPVDSLDEAISRITALPFGNAASIFTSNGGAAREFRHRVPAGNIGINVGVAAPMAMFPFAGMKDSFFGTLHPQGREVVDFFTDRKVIVTRWF
jgi:malonate-semialdehyde dehydrogenase (acetylating) / methylmalonate-semialdehyde dehydrogenase